MDTKTKEIKATRSSSNQLELPQNPVGIVEDYVPDEDVVVVDAVVDDADHVLQVVEKFVDFGVGLIVGLKF
ncbi:hypothetical protein WICMUC_003985 [Wickerhamomyces mucosus]|uniref:Uncharacterized protein n=1 Tax=Wickerhamomyces mucosus TaxID=1378264 RepID=A0A9P8PIF1_9ASCO|nr:hypothetical protein WICMUC_003985 [Wickerhamomyces mucosus]